MVFFDEDSDIKIYRRYSQDDINRYINLYLKEKQMGINFDALFLLAHKDLKKKKWLINEIHKGTTFPFDVNDWIDDYSMHLLTVFFILNSSNNMFSYVERNFIEEYVRNESEIEGVDYKTPNGKEIQAGLETMYRFLHSKENDSTTGSIMITDLHEKLFSHVEYGQYAREYRKDTRFFPGTGIELEDPYLIPRCMRQADRQFDELYKEAEKMSSSEIEDRINMVNPFLEKLMKYKIEVIRIHPFPDGNKRSTRGIVNFLLEKAGLPPVYVKYSELEKYQEALIQAMKYGNYQTITNFYKNKLCDSIEELVIDPFVFAINEYQKAEEEKEAKRQKGSNVLRLFNKDTKPKE